MSTVLFNPTNEDLSAQHVGETVIIKAGKKIKVDDKRARHVLNVLAPRGLLTLDYGDEGDKEKIKAEIGRRRNFEFKRKQVIRFNQENEKRMDQKLGYQEPTKQIAAYADEIGIALVQPYKAPDETTTKIADLTKEREDLAAKVKEKDEEMQALKGEIGELKTTLQNFMKMVEGGKSGSQTRAKPGSDKNSKDKTTVDKEAEPELSEEEQAKAIIKEFSGLSKYKFQDWVLQNRSQIPTYPKAVQDKIYVMWKKFFKEDFPEDLLKSDQETKSKK